MSELVILVPVLRRPHRVTPLMESIRAATPDARTLFICDSWDIEEKQAVMAEGEHWLEIDGNYAQKINAGIRHTDEPLIFLGADDLHFHPGWFEVAKQRAFGVVGTNDTLQRQRVHTTHFLITREYADRGSIDGPGLLHEGYDHSFIDDELIATAKARGQYAYAPEAIVEHHHWMNGLAEDDETYRKGRAGFRFDRKLFASRTPLWT